ncbi:hypothetical protein ACFFNY_18180 [Paenibacillus hodogayensis]|uniref:Uncharacterized protein n=1 Tax=Paenibacillus hodogayensis TaxID=279208 RepID=A0ABV5VYW6_9BACL
MEHFGEPITASFRKMRHEGLIGWAGISVSQNTAAEFQIEGPPISERLPEEIAALFRDVHEHAARADGGIRELYRLSIGHM